PTASVQPAAPAASAPAAPRTAPPAEARVAAAPPKAEPAASDLPPIEFSGDWPALAAEVTGRLERAGLVGQFLHQSEVVSHDADGFTLRVPVRPLAEPALVAKVRDVLAAHFGRPVRISVEIGQVRGTTVAVVRSREQAQALAQAQAQIEGDTFVRSLLDAFDGTILPESIQPIGPNGESR
ncbi:MAG TPA: DNA polymerase III subunit gamma/tau, partial [Burkholderiaceae bacterium]|nr:DNA polymerase III subunit gamma/tau [Burkholderiaceae bacterium]